MSNAITAIKYLRLHLHVPVGGGSERRAIGYLSQYGDLMRVSFDEAYIADPQRPVLSQGYQGETEAQTQAILRAARDTRVARSDGHWPAYFMNLLPESHNRRRLARERGCSEEDEFELLAAAGHDLMGALEVAPVPGSDEIPREVRHWHTALGLDVLEPGFVETPVLDGAALPGVVDKFSAIKDGRRYVVKRQGQAGSYILKLPSTDHPDLAENEYTGYRLCQALGLDCAQAELIPRAEAELPETSPFEHVLAVRRFDRELLPSGELRRVHFEEFCQAFGLEPRQKYGTDLLRDYGHIALVLEHLSAQPAHDLIEFVRRFVAFILMGNCDAHLKNWGLLYADGRSPRLAPVYDPVCVAAHFDDADPRRYGYNRAIDARLRAFSMADLETLLRAARLPQRRLTQLLRAAREAVAQARAEWPALLQDAPAAVRRTVSERLAGGVALVA
ncbi:type II toxin-antitoxin system HipA family toxin [Roseateles paludis]|jgi:serine/threonine-protein kinase HipA|uniref:HipA domain-containing protein n=1 Tax=Roseateles paludis TaxID=3145238 RepID=A0ABV0G4V4_9BURK